MTTPNLPSGLYVIKRDGRPESVHFDKITSRIRKLCYNLDSMVDPIVIAQHVCAGVYQGVTTTELDHLACQKAAALSFKHPDYSLLAGRICVSNLHKTTNKNFLDVCTRMMKHRKNGRDAPLITADVYAFIKNHSDRIQSSLMYDRDFNLDYFAIKTLLEQKYLTSIDRIVIERPSQMWMRIAASLWVGNIERTLETYEALSMQRCMHATPTLFNAGRCRQQLASCFLVKVRDDSIDGIFESLKDAALISKGAGGLGISVTHIRAKDSYIHGTDGYSQGLLPLLRVFNNVARYVDQCFAPETIVYTLEGPKQIQHITIADYLLSSTGTWAPLHKLLRHDYDGYMMKIQVQHALKPVQVTGAHQILCLRGNQTSNVIRKQLERGELKAEMMDASELLVSDFISFPLCGPESEVDIPSLSVDDCRMYGLMTGSGSIDDNSCSLSLSMEPLSTTIFVRNYFADAGIHWTTSQHEGTKVARFQWNTNQVGFKFSRSQFYNSSNQKILDSSLLNLPKLKLLAVLKGIKESLYSHHQLPSQESIQWILLRCGILHDPLLNDTDSTASSSSFIYDGYIYSRITSIEPLHKYKGTVHDFEMDGGNPTYVTSMGICHNGGGKRKGAFAMYLEPWHADTEEVLPLRENKGSDEFRARDLFLGLWIPDIFMERCESDGDWSYFCPSDVPDLLTLVGPAFSKRYAEYEREGKARRVVKARALQELILRQKVSTGTPYILFKDHCNLKSNHQHLGTIGCSNLCCEIIEFTAPDEIAVCNLASICLPKCVRPHPTTSVMEFDHKELFAITQLLTRNLNRLIDLNDYPVVAAKKSNLRHRNIGIGVQGLADAFLKLNLPFDCAQARELNRAIFETIYFASMSQSVDLAAVEGAYESFQGSPLSQGKFQFDLWNVQPPPTSPWNWSALRERVVQIGARNSLLVAPMPTASTSQIAMNNETIEPFTSNIFVRKTTAGEFICMNRWLVPHLQRLGLWNEQIQQKIQLHKGSIQSIVEIPPDVRELYRTVYEIPPESLIEMSADRGPYICQSQSLNLWMERPNVSDLNRLVFLAWRLGLKTAIYYLRTPPGVDPLAVTLSPELVESIAKKPTVQFDSCPIPRPPKRKRSSDPAQPLPHSKRSLTILSSPDNNVDDTVPLLGDTVPLLGNSCDPSCDCCSG